MKVRDVCRAEVYIVRRDEPLAEAAREMCNRHIGSIVVVEAPGQIVRPIGIVTDRDVVCGQLDREADLFCLSVSDVMTPKPLTLVESTGVPEAVEQMSARNVRRAPVINDAGELVGIVSLDDLLPAIAEDLTALAELIGTQARREIRT